MDMCNNNKINIPSVHPCQAFPFPSLDSSIEPSSLIRITFSAYAEQHLDPHIFYVRTMLL